MLRSLLIVATPYSPKSQLKSSHRSQLVIDMLKSHSLLHKINAMITTIIRHEYDAVTIEMNIIEKPARSRYSQKSRRKLYSQVPLNPGYYNYAIKHKYFYHTKQILYVEKPARSMYSRKLRRKFYSQCTRQNELCDYTIRHDYYVFTIQNEFYI